MSVASTLLRLLLCIALAFNGASIAHAGMQSSHAMPADAAQAAAPASTGDMAGMPCQATGQGSDVDHPQPAAPDPGGDKSPMPDCCKGSCHCACLQHATPAVVLTAVPVLVAHDAIRRHAPSAHVPPAILRLIRPPIG